MVRTILRGLLVVLLIALIVAASVVIVIDARLQSSEEKLLQDFAETKGLSVAFRQTNLSLWKDFPRVRLTVDSLVVRDTLAAAESPDLIRLGQLRASLYLGALLRDTVRLESVRLSHGALYIAADSSGAFNTGSLLASPDTTLPVEPTEGYAFATPLLTYDNSRVSLEDVAVTFLQPGRHKHIELAVDTLSARLDTRADGSIAVSTYLNTQVGQLAFNTTKGAYLRDTRLRGWLNGHFEEKAWHFPATRLEIGEQYFDLAAEVDRTPGALSDIYISSDSVTYGAASALVPADLQAKLADFHADGHFAASAHVLTTFARGEDTEVRVKLMLTGQDVRVKQYAFGKVHAEVAVVNRLDEQNHGIPGSRKNMRVDLAGVDGYWKGIHIQTDTALVQVFGKDARLVGPMRFTGPTEAVSDWLENENFFFSGGRFGLDVNVDASLLSYTEMIATTDGQLRLDDLNVDYRPAGVSFPFRTIELRKARKDVSFHLQSRPLQTGFTFALNGKLDNLTPLLIDVPGGRLRTDVALYAPRVDWTDFLTYFGEDGLMASGQDTTNTPPDNQAVKQALLGLQQTFQPSVEARFDTVAYYDVFALNDFSTGLHFDTDTLVLERTAFRWAGSEVAFGARLDLAIDGETPFGIDVATDHLNVNALRPTLEYFGLQLPVGLETLPDDLHIRFGHAGVIDDTFGIKPGFNVGNLDFDDGRAGLFAGNMNYRPGVTGLATNFHLDGDPAFVNELFAAENFFFGTGRFAIDLAIDGMPADLPGLIASSDMQLRVDSTRITYRPSDIYVPVERFRVDVSKGAATYSLDLFNDATRRAVGVSGGVDKIAAFLFPDSSETFTIETEIHASLLHLSDISGFIKSGKPDTVAVASTPAIVVDSTQGSVVIGDTAAFDARQLLSATGGIFSTLRPELSVQIDTFWASEQTQLIDVHAGLHMQDSTTLILERSGFTLGDGLVEIAATYRIDERARSPFTLGWQVKDLSLDRVGSELAQLGLPLTKDIGKLTGTLNLNGNLAGRFNEAGNAVDYHKVTGGINYRLTDVAVSGWQPLLDLGKKVKMRRRFEDLRFAPLSGHLSIDSGRVDIPRTEIQSTALQLFVEGYYDLATGADVLVSIPLKNIGRGVLTDAPAPTGYSDAGWKVYLVTATDDKGALKPKFRLGKRRYFKNRGRLAEWRALRAAKKKR